MKTNLLLILFIIFVSTIHGQGIKGKITDTENQPVAYANIFVPELKTGTTSNYQGEFELKLPEGKWEILFQYIGYKTVSQEFTIKDDFEEISVTMQSQSVKIKEIKVLASGEDPAYYVMRHAIAMAPYYNNQVSAYNCKLYLKGSGSFYKIPKLLRKQFEKDGIEEGESYVMETINEIHFELPDKLEQKVVAMQSTGNANNSSPMQMITNNLYNVDEYGIISPVGKSAMSEYKFKLKGIFEDQGKLINQIEVIPKNKQQGVFSGTINIVENYWNIHSADLSFSMPMMDVKMHQIYGLVEKNTWMPTSFDFGIDLKALGIGMKYIYVASFSDYSVTLNPNLDHSFLDKINLLEKEEKMVLDSLQKPEINAVKIVKKENKNQEKINQLMQKESLSNRDMRKLERLMDKEVERTMPPEPLEIPNPVKVLPGAEKYDSTFWTSIRPIPLTGSEALSFAEKDSIVAAHSTPEYKDSIRDSKRKFKIKDLIMGRNYRYDDDSVRFNSTLSVSGVINPFGLTFNTVDGFNYSLPFSYYLTDTTGRRLNLQANVSYAFSRKAFNSDFSLYYLYNGIKRQWINVAGGIKASDYKSYNSSSATENDFYTLFFEENLQKLYENRFLNILWGTEILNGLNFRGGFQFSKRTPLENHSNYKFINIKDKEYTPNIPDIEHLEPWQLQQSNASEIQFRLTYTPKQRYRIRNHVKYPAYSNKPTYTLIYEKGIKGLFGSDVNYDFISLSVGQSVSLGANGNMEYNISGGGFLNHKKLFAPDFKYFNANNQLITFSRMPNRFFELDYYKSIQKNYFMEAHSTFNFNKFILKRLPLLNRTMISESLFFNYLTTDFKNHYTEIGYSLNDIFLFMDAGLVVSFENLNYRSIGVKLNINLE